MIWWHDFIRIVFITNTILAFYIVFHRKRSVSTTWAWLIILLILPVVGITLYAFFGRGISQENILPSINRNTSACTMFRSQLLRPLSMSALLIRQVPVR